MHNGVNCKNNKNISRKLWTNRVGYGKICNGEQPGFYTMALDGFALAKGGMPYDEMGRVYRRCSLVSISRNGHCPVFGQVKRFFVIKKSSRLP